MIAYLKGSLLKKTDDTMIVAAGAVGYELFVSPLWLDSIQVGEQIEAWCVFVVSENSQRLFGFKEYNHREMFLILTGISGVGPKTALQILSVLSPEQIAQAVREDDDKVFRQISGVGPKVAQRLVVELADKVSSWSGFTASLSRTPHIHSDDEVVLETLQGLGYTRNEINRILLSLDKDLSVEDKITAVIKQLGQ